MQDILMLAAGLRERGEPFALATVVRCERPTSAKPGAKALIRPDGRVAGWVGGACAEPVVAREALAALRDGQPRLVVLVGDGGRDPARTEGIVHFPMTCHSGGTLEIYVEPFLPKALLVLVGHGPVIETLATVVRCERPTSAKPGAKALIRPDGRVVGWVGGACAEPVVAREAQASLRDGQPRLVVLVGDGGRDPARTEGIVHFPMTCHSGGTL
ncbi:MAG TPA: XdhC family protein, partial [Candidatus Dormibacteraeota bacterium]|nr:XdhC family protein [Candidatus Dormibacteraeota bacterium]